MMNSIYIYTGKGKPSDTNVVDNGSLLQLAENANYVIWGLMCIVDV